MPDGILISFVGGQDPQSPKGGGTPGPILTLARERRFSRIYLLHTPDQAAAAKAQETAARLFSHQTGLRPVCVPLAIDDPTSHEKVLAALRTWWKSLPENPSAEYYISISSGTPAMHACWLLLAASDEIHASILYTRDPRHVAEGQPLVCEINPRSPVFPQILPRVSMAEVSEPDSLQKGDLAAEMGLIGEAPNFCRAINMALKFAASDHNVLITGETGTGKERFARLIHSGSKRARGPFVDLNCASFAVSLIESELFGHVKGSFTGADKDKMGLFEVAHGGTLFLDEIGDMPPEVQVKLLRALQERKIRRVGGTTDIPVDVRIVAATHVDLARAQQIGVFRQDLFQRLNILPLHLPPLRERSEDISFIAQTILDAENRSNNALKSFSSEAVTKLLSYSWPGNIRELEGVIKFGFVMSEGAAIDVADLRFSQSALPDEVPLPTLREGFSVSDYLNECRYRIYTEALKQADGNQSRAARLLDCSSTAIMKFLREHQVTFGTEGEK